MRFWQRFWALFRPDFRAYEEAYSKYEEYSKRLDLGLLGPTDHQVELARSSPLTVEIDSLYDRALEASKAAGMPYNVATVIYQKGLLRRLAGEFHPAEDLFKQALREFEVLLPEHATARTSVTLCHFYLGQAMLRLANPQEAVPHLKLASSLGRALDMTAIYQSAEHLLSECASPGTESNGSRKL